MVNFVSFERAKELVRHEPVVFAEIMSERPDAESLELHVMYRYGVRLHEAERDDTGPVPKGSVRDVVARVAAARDVRYATIYQAEEQWPPPWA